MHRAATLDGPSIADGLTQRRKGAKNEPYPPASAGRRVESPDDFRFLPRFPRTRRPGRRSRHAYTSPRHREHHRLAHLKRPTAAGSERLHKRAENDVADASQPHESRDKTLRRFTRAQIQSHQDHPAAPPPKRGNYVARNEFSRHNSPRQNPLNPTTALRSLATGNCARLLPPDGHLCTKPEGNGPKGDTPLMAIYGAMAIYGLRASSLGGLPSDSRIDLLIPLPRSWRLG
jgi:hypothetical protein